MAEIYKNYTSPVITKIFWDGEIINADANLVTAKIYDITLQDFNPIYDPSGSEFDPDNLLATISATKIETDDGTYQIIVPRNLCTTNRKFEVLWEYFINGSAASHVTFIDVVTPYTNLSDIWEDLNIGTDPSDPNYKTYHEIQMAEKYARKLIEAFTAQYFYTYNEIQIVYGYGSDILPLPFKINQIHELYENDVLLVDNINSISNWTYVPQISESGFGIRVSRQNFLDNTIYTANGLVPPSVNDINYQYAFKKDARYRIEGLFGWSYIPANVEEACVVLIKQFFEKDTQWRNKYVRDISAFDYKFTYMEDAHRGTGNLYADQLLLPYVITGLVAF